MIETVEKHVLHRSIRANDWQREAFSANGTSSEPVHARPQRILCPWEAVIDKVIAIQNLGDDWDGLGAVAPTGELLASAVGLAYLLKDRGMEPPNAVVASLSGTVVFEWQWPDGTYGELEVDRPLHAEVMLTKPGQPAEHWELPDA